MMVDTGRVGIFSAAAVGAMTPTPTTPTTPKARTAKKIASPFVLVVTAFFFAAALLLPQPARASDFNSPHAHAGVVHPFSPGDPKVELDDTARQILDAGKPYQTQMLNVDDGSSGSGSSTTSSSGGRGMVVQDINAPPDVVWGRILDHNHYADMVPKTVESENYEVIQHKPTRKDPLERTIYTRMKVGFPLLKLEFYIKHLYYPTLNSLTWTLDYTKQSDFDDSVGYWYVIPHPDDNDHPEGRRRTRVYYSVQVSMFDWVPKFVVDFMSNKALTDATSWVKKYSELEWGKDPRRIAAELELERTLRLEEAGGTAAIGDPEKAKGGGGGLFSRIGGRRKRRKAAKAAALEKGEAAAVSSPNLSSSFSSAEVCDSGAIMGSTTATTTMGDDEKQVLANVGWLRIFLLTLVSALAVYNVALFLDGISQ